MGGSVKDFEAGVPVISAFGGEDSCCWGMHGVELCGGEEAAREDESQRLEVYRLIESKRGA
jgi:hypothetical protein